MAAYNAFEAEIPAAKKALVDEFRKILGVQDSLLPGVCDTKVRTSRNAISAAGIYRRIRPVFEPAMPGRGVIGLEDAQDCLK